MDKIVLERIYGIKVSQAQVDGLNDCLEKFGILGPVQVAQFIAQVGVESGLLRYTKELGKDAYFDVSAVWDYREGNSKAMNLETIKSFIKPVDYFEYQNH